MPYKSIGDRRIWDKARGQRNVQEYREYKESIPCTDCGGKFPHFVTEWDHKESKVFNISQKAHFGLSSPMFQSELAKCDLVCANCHKIRTHTRRQSALRKDQAQESLLSPE